MIKFFRHIRQTMIKQNKFSKPASPAGRYLFYAIGEIILVVIGILIALQINNWNEERKSDLDLNNSLQLMASEINQDLSFYNQLINTNKQYLEFLIELSNGNYNEIDLKTTPFKISKNLFPRNFGSAYYSLKDNGTINRIENEALRNKIVTYYEELCVNFNNYSDWHNKFVAENIDNYIVEKLKIDQQAYSSTSTVIEEMQNGKLASIVNFQIVLLKRIETLTNENISYAQGLLSQLKEDINIQ